MATAGLWTVVSPPEIQSVRGNDVANIFAVKDAVVITGRGLGDVSVALVDALDETSSTVLAIRSQSTETVEAILPVDVVSGAYSLVVTNTAGTDQETVTLTLPELDGETLITRINSEATSSLDIRLLPVGTGADQVAAGDHSHDIMGEVLANDGAGSGLDADLLGGAPSADYLNVVGDSAARVDASLLASMLTNTNLDNFNAAPALDGDTATVAWHTDTAAIGAALTVDLGVALELVGAGLYMDAADYGGLYHLEYSDDGSAWDAAYEWFRPAVLGWNDVRWASVGAHQYWRFYLANAPGPGAAVTQIRLVVAVPGRSVHVSAAGEMGIGTDVPTAKLDVVGDVAIRGEKVGGTSWGFKAGPTSLLSAYTSVWSRGGGGGSSIECTSDTAGCMILKDGIYDIQCVQRVSGSNNPYVGIGLAGDRTVLETRVDALWTHSHGGASGGNYTESFFVGSLVAGDLITCGAPAAVTAADLVYGASGYVGMLKIVRLN